MSFFAELKRRNVIRLAIAYVAISWLLIQVVETLFPIYDLSDAAIRTVVAVIAVGFIPTLVITWIFELTPDGLKRDAEVDHDDPGTLASHKTLDRIILLILALGFSYLAFDKFVLDPARDIEMVEEAAQQARSEALLDSYGEKSIAVLPFVNMSSDVEQEYFSDGISEEVLNLLAKINGLRVISRTSAFSYKGSDKTVPQIAGELNVAHILEGSVRKAGDRIRLTFQLIEAGSDTHLWSETYDRELQDIFAIQDEVAGIVVEQLKIELDVGLAPVARHDPQAYALYLQAAQLLRAEAELNRAETLLLQALDIEPEYLDAKVALSWVYSFRAEDADVSSDAELAEQHYTRQHELLDEVTAIDPDNVQLNVARGWDNMRNVEIAASYIERALAADPSNAQALNAAVTLLTRLWRHHEAIPIAEYISKRDPLYAYALWNLARAALNDGQYELAEKTYRAHLSVRPGGTRGHWLVGLTFLLRGNAEAALEQFQEQLPHEALRLQGTALALHNLGRQDDADGALAALIAFQDIGDYEEVRPYLIATAYAWFGDADRAFEYLEKQRETWSGFIRIEAHSPLYQKIENDPRWIPFRESVGVGPDQLGAVDFNPRLPNDLK